MSTPVNTSSTDSQMHNNIMAAGSKDRPPMLGPGRYSQWRSRFLRTKPQRFKEQHHLPQQVHLPDTKQRESPTHYTQSESVSVSDEDSDPEQAQRDKEMQKNLALLANQRQFGNQRGPMQFARVGTVGSQADWLEDTDEEIDETGIEAHYSFLAKYSGRVGHSEQPESINDTYVLEKDDSNVTPDSSNICTNDNQVDQNAVECVDERDALANLIANLTLDTEENKTILKQLKKANASLTQELEKCKTNP
ncbi:hypothetical protein Tco_0273027 [Tanacetum coccineum]